MAISNNLELWKQEAEENAKKYSDSIKQSNQYNRSIKSTKTKYIRTITKTTR